MTSPLAAGWCRHRIRHAADPSDDSLGDLICLALLGVIGRTDSKQTLDTSLRFPLRRLRRTGPLKRLGDRRRFTPVEAV